MDMLHNGLQQFEHIALGLNQVAVGGFFAISGYHKFFNAERHAALVKTLQEDGVPLLKFNAWWVPMWELVAGSFVALGIMAPLFSLPLLAICLVACCVDGRKRVHDWQPIDKADLIDDWLYLPEVLYIFSLLIVLFAGPGFRLI